jgi:DNA-binding protein H-NS
MSNLIEIQNQIEKLQKQAIEIRSREFNKTVQEIRSQMSAFGITFKDLQLNKVRGKVIRASKVQSKIKTTKAAVKKTTTVAAKYCGPNGEMWSGRGLTPRWLATLLAQGRKKEEFTIKLE